LTLLYTHNANNAVLHHHCTGLHMNYAFICSAQSNVHKDRDNEGAAFPHLAQGRFK